MTDPKDATSGDTHPGDLSGPRRGETISGGMNSCWFCARPVSPQALFCHGCGSLQAPAETDAFTRLKLAPRFELEQADLDRQAAGFTRILDPARLEKRGPMERTMAERHRAAIAAAHEELRDPLRRARLLLLLAGRPAPPAADAGPWQAELAAAHDAMAVDRIAARVTRELENALRDLAAAFRAEDLNLAAETVARAEALSLAVMEGRVRRSELLGASPGF